MLDWQLVEEHMVVEHDGSTTWWFDLGRVFGLALPVGEVGQVVWLFCQQGFSVWSGP